MWLEFENGLVERTRARWDKELSSFEITQWTHSMASSPLTHVRVSGVTYEATLEEKKVQLSHPVVPMPRTPPSLLALSEALSKTFFSSWCLEAEKLSDDAGRVNYLPWGKKLSDLTRVLGVKDVSMVRAVVDHLKVMGRSIARLLLLLSDECGWMLECSG